MPNLNDDTAPLILSADGVQIVIDVSTGTLVVVHWGRDVGDADFTPSPHDPGLWRENARGFLGRPALIGDRDGHDWSPKFEVSRVESNATSVTIESVDAAASLLVTATFELAPAGVLTVSQAVTNTGDSPYRLHELTTWLPLPAHATDTLDFTGHWGHERQPQRRPIQVGAWSRESREGRSGTDHTIVQLALSDGAGFRDGEVWALGVQWSGNLRQIVERVATGAASSAATAIGAGELLLPGEVVLGAGETYAAPSIARFCKHRNVEQHHFCDNASAEFDRRAIVQPLAVGGDFNQANVAGMGQRCSSGPVAWKS